MKSVVRYFFFVLLAPSLPVHSFASEPPSFNQDVRPILSNNCFHCHGPDEEERQADLRLDEAGDWDATDLVSRITESDQDLVMPPPESHKRLTANQIQILKRWAEAGAEYEQHWSFLAPQQTPQPEVDPETYRHHLIDRFVAARLQSEGMQPSAPADKRTLIRRVSMDLTGLPPTPAEIDAFLEDEESHAYDRVVDRLLDSPHYGEHQARYWLDLVRFADTNGLHHDHYREMTPYRDWVIRAFNSGLPYDQFVSAQVAGDLYEQPTDDQLIASGFNRLHLIIDRGTALPEESFTRNVVDRVSSIGTAFLGLTLECAVCHDHKYDPITQRDFYQLFAFFNNFDGGPETGGRRGTDFNRGLQPPYLELPDEQQERQLAELNLQIETVEAQLESLGKANGKETKVAGEPQSEEASSKKGRRKELQDRLSGFRKQRDQVIESIPATLVMKERQEMRPAFILVRGNYDQPGDPVERDTPGFLPPLQPSGDQADRMDLARWLVRPDNPLTARVAVNRFWQQLFGVGLVKTSEDFGAQGEPPSHPELLDQLALEFVSGGWDVKALQRSIVLSETYRQESVAPTARFVADPENRLLGRGSRFRYDAEVIRDQVLSVSGLLNPSLYGKSVKPPQPAGLWQIVAMPNSYPRIFKSDLGDQIYRRSVYSFWKRALPPPQMTIFDAPTREACSARRERTNTPLQALVLMNEQQYFFAAMKLSAGLLSQAELSDQQRIALAYTRVTSHPADDETMQTLLAALQEFREQYENRPEAAKQMIDQNRPADVTVTSLESLITEGREVELAALTMVTHSLLNLDLTKTRE